MNVRLYALHDRGSFYQRRLHLNGNSMEVFAVNQPTEEENNRLHRIWRILLVEFRRSVLRQTSRETTANRETRCDGTIMGKIFESFGIREK